LFLFYLS